jgi:hypothetical protein
MFEMKSLFCAALGGGKSVLRWGVLGVLALGFVCGPGVWGQDGGGPQQDEQAQDGQVDPPSQVARISVLGGTVSVEPASVDEFTAAEANYPLTTGDRVYTDQGASAELETDALAVRVGQQTDLTVTAMTDTLAQFGLASGSAHLRSYSLDPSGTVELDTPNVAVTVLQPGDVRVDVNPQSGSTMVMVISGQVQVDGNGLQQVLQAGQRVRLSGRDPVAVQSVDIGEADTLDRFSSDRDAVYEEAQSQENQYVSSGTIGAADLSGNGDWENDGDEGAVWYPTGVAVGWQPYSCGRWAWVAPWGWTWVGCESWGFAPFHYGRWVRRGPRWGWIPGPPRLHPVYSPALVRFVGGGAGVTAWFPLGPREVYVPWYPTSTLYVNRVNVSNIYSRNLAQARTIYNQRATNAYDTTGTANKGYVNRQNATIAVSQTNFAAGRPVLKAQVHVDPREMDGAPLLAHPLVTPTRAMVVAAPVRGVPVRVERPVMGEEVPRRTTERTDTPMVAEPARPLFNKAVPPAPRPSFELQQKTMETTEPGKPLSPREMQELRPRQAPVPGVRPASPAAAPARQAPAARPAPTPRPEAAPRSSPPAPPALKKN